jgi:hypothetical protein
MNHKPQVHESVPDNGVRDQRDESQQEVRSRPGICRTARHPRMDEVCCHATGDGEDRSYSDVLELHLRSFLSVTPFLNQETDGYPERYEEVGGKEWIERPCAARQAAFRYRRSVGDVVCREGEDCEGDGSYEGYAKRIDRKRSTASRVYVREAEKRRWYEAGGSKAYTKPEIASD